mmetsp:Transcript_28132/g.53252  ORF Transcript_28132/g.53252 Transcript_28132/m.53252 type:complete len:445 (+) Transcript_28132:140-1474(+)
MFLPGVGMFLQLLYLLYIPSLLRPASALALSSPILATAAAPVSAVPTWTELSEALPIPSTPTPELVLYRDNNGWCPFCERVWIALEEKGIPYTTELINLRDKPKWYKDMVPTTLVPAVKFKNDDKVVWESMEVIKELDERYPERKLIDEQHESDMKIVDNVVSSAVKYSFSSRNATLTESQKQELENAFEDSLIALDVRLAPEGPFFGGAEPSAADFAMIPMMERNRWQLPVTSPTFPRLDGSEWPALAKWFRSFDQLDSYSRPSGDELSWLTVSSVFLKMFGGNGTSVNPSVAAKIVMAEKAAEEAVEEVRAKAAKGWKRERIMRFFGAKTREEGIEAARKIIDNHEAVVNDACSSTSEAKSQVALARLSPDSKTSVDLALRTATARLLNVKSERPRYEDKEAARQGMEFIARRVCAPRDMGANAAVEFRRCLLKEAGEIVKN